MDKRKLDLSKVEFYNLFNLIPYGARPFAADFFYADCKKFSEWGLTARV